MCSTCGCKDAESFEAETWGVQIYDTDLTMTDVKNMLKDAGIKTKGSVRKIGNGYGYYFKFDSSHQSKFENAFKKFGKAGNYEYEAESFDADWDNAPYGSWDDAWSDDVSFPVVEKPERLWLKNLSAIAVLAGAIWVGKQTRK